MKLSLRIYAFVIVNMACGFPSPTDPPQNLEKIQNSQAALDMHTNIFMRYNLAGLMEMWRHPGEHDCEEWAPSVMMEADGIKYTWCGNSFCADIYTQDDVLIDKIDIQVY